MITPARSDYPKPSSSKIPPDIILRPAKASDAEAMSTCFVTSWHPSHPFWKTQFTGEAFNSFWIESFSNEANPQSAYFTYVAVDTNSKPDDSFENKALPSWEQKGANVSDGRIVAFTRWRVPQEDGNLDEGWPDLPEGLDMEIMEAFFGGMEHNHTNMMGKRPHWFLQLLGTEWDYQKQGIGKCFTEWGCQRADEDGLECYVDASELGAPLYKSCGFEGPTPIIIPDRDVYGHVDYISFRRPKKGASVENGHVH